MKTKYTVFFLLFFSFFTVLSHGQTAFTITYTGLAGSAAAVGVPTSITNTTPYNGVDASCVTSTDNLTSYTTTITAKAGYNFTITSISGTAYASSAGYKGYQFRISSSNNNFTTTSSSVGCTSTSSNCGTAVSVGSLTGTFTTTAGNSCTITVLKSKCGSESGGGYSKTKTLVISGTYTAVVAGATKLALIGTPTTGTVNTSLASFTVEARKADNSVDNTYTSNITISKASGTGTLSGTVTKAAVAGVATFNDLKFDAAATYTISVASTGLTGATSSNIVISAPTSVATDYFRSKQNGNWNATATWESSHDNAAWFNATLVPDENATNTIINHVVTATGDITVSNTTITGAGDTLKVAPAIAITVAASKVVTVNINGGLVLQSTSAGTARVASSVGGSIVGNVTMERYIAGGLRGFRFLGNPFGAALPLTQLTDDIDITGNASDAANPPLTATGSNAASAFSYNPMISDAGTVTAIGTGGSATADPGWVSYTTANGIVEVGSGFRVLVRGEKGQAGTLTGAVTAPLPVTLNATGQLNPIGSFSKTIAYSTGSPSYNLVSNPYPSAINLKTATVGSGVNNNFWIFNVHQGTKGGYLTYAFGTDDYALPSFGGFMVKAINSEASTITFEESDKVLTASVDTSTMLRNVNSNKGIVEFNISSGNIFWDRFLLQLNKKGTENYDVKWDAEKFANSELSFYSLSNESKALAIDVRPFEENKAIRLGVISNTFRSYTLAVGKYELDENMLLILRDNYLGTETKIEEGMVYQFAITSDAASQGEHRFEILTKAKSIPVIPIISIPDFYVRLSPNPTSDIVKVTFNNLEKLNTALVITNAEGKIVHKADIGNLQSGQVDINVKGFAKGVYYVTLSNSKATKTEKLQIQ